MVTFIVVLIGPLIGDQFQPYAARVYGVGHFPWDNRDQVRMLHKHYGLFRLPRSLFVLAVLVAMYGTRIKASASAKTSGRCHSC